MHYNYSKEKVKPQDVTFPLMLIQKRTFSCFIFWSNIFLIPIFHDSMFKAGMVNRSQVVAMCIILRDVYIL